MSQGLCQAIVDYIQNKCSTHEDLSNTGREVIASHKYGILTDDERDRIFAAGKKKRHDLEQQKGSQP
jgi:hypothetical protein